MLIASKAFAPASFLHFTQHGIQKVVTGSSYSLDVSLSMAGKKTKGFSKNISNEIPKKVSPVANSDNAEILNTQSTTTKPEPTQTMSAGADALSRLRRQQAEERDEELRAISEMKAVDENLRQNPDSAVIPERVAQRMGKRMLPFVGIPLFGLMGTFVTFWYLATYRNMEFQPALVAFSTIGVLGIGLLGITYSVMSASWDSEVEGSFIGLDEFKNNFGSIKDGLARTRQNAILREKMAGLPEAEVEQAIKDLEKRESKSKRSKLSMEEKMQKELE